MMTISPVENSSNIQASGHDPETNTMLIQFHNGKSYKAVGVPAEDYAAFRASHSKGSHFSKHLKHRHTFNLIPDAE